MTCRKAIFARIMIKNLIFDFGKVLVDYDFSKFVSSIMGNSPLRDSFESYITSKDFMNSCDKEDVPFEEVIRKSQEAHPEYREPLQLFHDRYNDIVTGEVPGMKDLLRRLRTEGFRLYGCSNWCSKVKVTIRSFGIFDLLDGYVLSSEEHIIKPEPEIYMRLLEKYSLKAEESIFADDRQDNIDGAQKVGIKGILFKDAVQFEKELREITGC